MSDTDSLLHAVERATTPADLFGAPASDAASVASARRARRAYALALHPDHTRDERAHAAFMRMGGLYDAWVRESATADMRGARGRYALGERLARGTVANVYAATDERDRAVCVKVARRPTSNRFLRRERDALRTLESVGSEPGNAWLAAYHPRLLDTLALDPAPADRRAGVDPRAERRHVNVLDALGARQGFLTLADVRACLTGGLDGRDWAWILRRLLRTMTSVHAAGLVHGAVLAENVLIHPRDHGVVLAGWSFATRPGEPAEGIVASQREAYPPEATDGVLTPASDIAMLGALSLRMLRDQEPAQRRFALGCMQAEPRMRPGAHELQAEYDDLLDRLYGERRFRPFPLAV